MRYSALGRSFSRRAWLIIVARMLSTHIVWRETGHIYIYIYICIYLYLYRLGAESSARPSTAGSRRPPLIVLLLLIIMIMMYYTTTNDMY